MAGLLKILKEHNLPIPADYDERVAAIVSCLRRKPDCKQRLNAFKNMTGGAEGDPENVGDDVPVPSSQAPAPGPSAPAPGPSAPAPGPSAPASVPVPKPLEPWNNSWGKYPAVSKLVPPRFFPDNTDYLGPRLKWILKATASPYAPVMFEALFMVVFFISYLEKIPVFGSILGASLDLIIAGGKVLLKTIQSILPATFGMIPLPYSYMVGFGLSAALGMFLWPVFAIVATSRQDFVSAIESWIRVIPPPIGDILANNFLEVNRMAGRIDEKRVKIGNDISTALTAMAGLATQVSKSAQDGLVSLSTRVRDASSGVKEKATQRASELAERSQKATLQGVRSIASEVERGKQEARATAPPAIPPPPPPTPPTGGFHRRTRRKVWSRRSRSRKRFGRG